MSDKIFTKAIKVNGDLISTFVFENAADVKKWRDTILPRLELQHGSLAYSIRELDSLKIGDTCCVMGEGTETFKIIQQIQYSPNRYGFVLDSGWSEEVNKCYKPR